MKKFYTLFLAIVTAFAACAEAQLRLVPLSEVNHCKEASSTAKTGKPFNLSNLSKRLSSRADGAIALEELEGEYEWNYTSMLGNGSYGAGFAKIEIKDADDGIIALTLSDTFTIEGKYTDGEISFAANQYLGYNSTYKIDVYFYHMRWNEDSKGKYNVDEPMVASVEYSYEGAVKLDFDPFDIIVIGNHSAGYFIGAYSNEMLPPSEWYDPIMPEEGWEKYSTSTFTDGWQIGAYGKDPADFPYDVIVEKNTSPYYENVKFYRIVNPYGPGTPLFKYNQDQNGGKGYILFTLLMPDFVMAMPLTYSGLEDAEGAYLNCNLEGYGYYFVYDLFPDKPDWTIQDIIDLYGLENISNYENNVVTFYNCVFGTKREPFKTVTWTDKNGPINYPATLTLPATGENDGVDNVNADFDGTVRYFNLQGLPVENPGNGIYIKQEGGKTFKVRVVR